MGGAQDAEARVDSFNGFSVGTAVGPGTLTVALDMHSGTGATVLGEDLASALVPTAATACGQQTTGFGINFSGDVGADLSFTYGSGSTTASAAGCTGDNATNTASANTMGLGVGIPIGGMKIAIDYESTTHAMTAATVDSDITRSGFELSFTMPVGDATAGINISSATETLTVAGNSGDGSVSGTELWYTVPIGPVSLSAGYGSAAVTDGATTTEIGAEMSMSF